MSLGWLLIGDYATVARASCFATADVRQREKVMYTYIMLIWQPCTYSAINVQAHGEWSAEEHALFLQVAQQHGVGDKWGLFSSWIPRGVGYQCSSYYR
jgi:hypothetical protein